MGTEIETWLAEKEREALEELQYHEGETEKRRVALSMIRQWRHDAADATRNGATGGPRSEPQGRLVPAQAGSPPFDDSTDPTGKRRAIWRLLDERRGRVLSVPSMHSKLIRRGEIPASTPQKMIQITARRMSEKDYIEKAGRGAYTLPVVGGEAP